MGSAPSDGKAGGAQLTPVKIVVAGGFGVGTTTLVSAISEIRPLRAEEALTQVSVGVDEPHRSGLDPNAPALLCDARQRDSVKDVLITVVQHVLTAGPMDGHQASGDPGAVGQHGAAG
jgi:hypothetical protein